ncbi:MAG TPA: hypothetical protein VHN19_05945 [Burkholderiales bacterium]|jgi:hypothetical protein|nr:hypothetical protein [Burkholderiales bacterium]
MFKKLALTALAGTALLASSAFAHDGHWNRGHRWHHGYVPHRVVVVPPAPVYVRPAPVYYTPPAPVYYTPAPVVVAPPRPTIVYRQPGLSVRVGF